MGAGDGAAEQARRAAERAEEARRAAARADRQSECWAKGAVGERLVAAAVAPLAEAGWYALHDIHWPGRQRANIDHVLIGPGGVVVVDAKNWVGVTVRDGIVRQNGYRRLRETQDVLDQAAAITALLGPPHRSAVRGWLCLVGQPQLVASTALGVEVVGVDRIAAALRTLPVALDQPSIRQVYDRLTELEGEPAGSLTSAAGRALGQPSAREATPRGARTARGRAPRRVRAQPARGPVMVMRLLLFRLLMLAAMAVVIFVGVHLITDELSHGLQQLGPTSPSSTSSPAGPGSPVSVPTGHR